MIYTTETAHLQYCKLADLVGEETIVQTSKLTTQNNCNVGHFDDLSLVTNQIQNFNWQ